MLNKQFIKQSSDVPNFLMLRTHVQYRSPQKADGPLWAKHYPINIGQLPLLLTGRMSLNPTAGGNSALCLLARDTLPDSAHYRHTSQNEGLPKPHTPSSWCQRHA